MMVLAIIAGAFVGAAIMPLGNAYTRFLLKSRDKSFEPSRREMLVVAIVLACLGACIGFCAQTIPTACYLFVLLLIADVAALSDFHHRVIPNELLLELIIVRTAFGIPALLGVDSFPQFDMLSAALGLVVCAVIFVLPSLAGKKVGAGDVKFIAVMGFCLGLKLSLYALALMGILVFIYMLYGRRMAFSERLKQLIPMAPFACGAMMVVLLVQTSPMALL